MFSVDLWQKKFGHPCFIRALRWTPFVTFTRTIGIVSDCSLKRCGPESRRRTLQWSCVRVTLTNAWAVVILYGKKKRFYRTSAHSTVCRSFFIFFLCPRRFLYTRTKVGLRTNSRGRSARGRNSVRAPSVFSGRVIIRIL